MRAGRSDVKSGSSWMNSGNSDVKSWGSQDNSRGSQVISWGSDKTRGTFLHDLWMFVSEIRMFSSQLGSQSSHVGMFWYQVVKLWNHLKMFASDLETFGRESQDVRKWSWVILILDPNLLIESPGIHKSSLKHRMTFPGPRKPSLQWRMPCLRNHIRSWWGCKPSRELRKTGSESRKAAYAIKTVSVHFLITSHRYK